MLDSMSSKAIFTKIKAMYGHRLREEDFEQLMHKSSVPACAAYLKSQTWYGKVLRDVQETQIHRGALEELLGRAVFEQYSRLVHYAGKGNRFYRYYLIKQEIGMIINAVRLIGNDDPNEFVSAVPGYLLGSVSFDVLSLAACKSFAEVLEVLRRTPYYKVLSELQSGDGGPASLPLVEHALYDHYYKTVLAMIDQQFRGKTAEELREMFCTKAELISVTSLFRLKRSFADSPLQLHEMVLRYKGRLPGRLMEQIVNAQDAAEVLGILAHSAYSRYFDKDNFVYIEYSAGSIRYNLAKKYLTFSQNTTTAFVAFMVLQEIEIENLINIIEGVRYKQDISQMRALLIRGGV